MAKSVDLLRWKKQNNLVTFVMPNSAVTPEVVHTQASDPPELVNVYRLHERLIRGIFGGGEVIELKIDTTTVIDGKTHVLYETWIAPHLPPIDRHTKYVFKTEQGTTSAPLYVSAPVQITFTSGSNVSGTAGFKPAMKGEGKIDRSRTLNMQVSAPIDPTLTFDVITANQNYSNKLIVDAVYRYASGLSGGDPHVSDKITQGIFKEFGPYLSGDGGIVDVDPPAPITIDEGATVTIPLEFTPLRSGRTMLVVSATDEHGKRVYSDFIGLNCDTDSMTVTREF